MLVFYHWKYKTEMRCVNSHEMTLYFKKILTVIVREAKLNKVLQNFL